MKQQNKNKSIKNCYMKYEIVKRNVFFNATIRFQPRTDKIPQTNTHPHCHTHTYADKTRIVSVTYFLI